MYIEAVIYKDNLKYNIRNIKNKIGETSLIAVIKGDAYGHGLKEIVQICIEEGIKKFCVGTIEEAIDLRKIIDLSVEVLLLLPPTTDNIKKLVKYNITPTVCKLEHLKILKYFYKDFGFELEINTGLGRGGCKNQEYQEIMDFIIKNNMNLKGMYTHLYNKNSIEDSKKQLEEFKKYRANNIKNVKYHIGGGYAFCYGKQFLMDELRVGIALYGLADLTLGDCRLKPVMELNSKIYDIIQLKKGERLGYIKNEFVADKNIKLALINIGYTMGIPILDKYVVKVNDKFCKIVGGLNMMNCCVDITDVTNVKVGDWVNIYSVNNDDKNTILNLSKSNNIKPGIFVSGLNSKFIKRTVK